MSRKLSSADAWDSADLRRLGDDLKLCLKEAKRLNCPGLADKIRSAIKSHGGATRHMERRLSRQ